MTGPLRPCGTKVIRSLVMMCLGGILTTPSVGQTIIWTDSNAKRIQRKDVNGGEVGTVVQFQSSPAPYQIEYDPVAAKLYYYLSEFPNGTPTTFQRANLDGTERENIPTPSVGAFTLNVDSRKLYWISPSPGNVLHWSELDGSGVESHTYPSCCVGFLEALGDDLYFGAGGTMQKGIWRADADGSNEQYLHGKSQPFDLAYDPIENKLYVGGFSLIYRMNLDGTDDQPVLQLSAHQVVVDSRARKLYWGDRNARVIRRSNLDGSNVEDFVTASDVGNPNFNITGLTIVYGSTPVPDPSGAKGRALSFFVPPPTASGPLAQTAIRLTMITLQDPDPANLPCCPPPDFGAFESATCTASGESNGCARWVGKPGNFLESQDNAGLGTFRGARVQCTPFYFDWVTQTAGSPINVVGAEIVPSSTYTVQTYAESCNGSEIGCTDVSAAVTMPTRRYGDVELPFNPPSLTTQPDVTDVAQLVNKFKNVPGAPSKVIAQIQPNLVELNADINALDILAVVNAVKQFAYAFSGPCACPSFSTCGVTPCTTDTVCESLPPASGGGSGAMCVKSCTDGSNAGDRCINDTHCPSGTCGGGFCRDRCGRCTP